MERKDYKKTGGYPIGGHDEGWVETDESTVELSGTRAEVDLIVDALSSYIAVQSLLAAHRVEINRPKDSLYRDIQRAGATTLLESIAEPVYQEQEVAASQL